MAERIAHHRARRPPSWRTIEAPTHLAERLGSDVGLLTVLVEDLTLLLSNHMEHGADGAEERTRWELERLTSIEANLVIVSNEVGMGLVPPYPLGRAFRDALGRVNQAAAAACTEVYFIVAGLPLRMK
jgi:adenosylcobinamide kinase/adenosylcobinamide-phosphate guanylyltransferase